MVRVIFNTATIITVLACTTDFFAAKPSNYFIVDAKMIYIENHYAQLYSLKGCRLLESNLVNS